MSRPLDPSCLDMIDRVSRGSSLRRSSRFSHDHESATPHYHNSTTLAAPSRDGEQEKSKAQAPPPPIALSDPRWAGLVVHSVAIGVVSTALPLTVYPFLTVYLNMEGTQTLSARTLLAIPWFFRPFFRILMDSAPLVFGQHHRPYVMIGWLITSLALGAIYFIEIPDPYFADVTLIGKPLASMTPAQRASLNQDAPAHGAVYILLMTVATIGYVLADVAADALIEGIAQRCFPPATPDQESPFVPRVTMQRYAAMLVTFLFMGIGMSGYHYGGEFDFTLSYNETMLIIGVIASIAIPFAWLHIEEVASTRPSLSACFRLIWSLFQNKAIAHVIACRFLGGVFSGMSATPVNPIALYWAGVQPLNDNTVSFVATGAVIGFVVLADKKEWTINYRLAIIGVNAVVLVLDCGATLLTIWDVVRSQWLWIGLPVMEALPSGLDYVILTVILSEVAEPGTEELMQSLITAISFLATPFALTVTKYIDALFDVTNDSLARDTTDVRLHATAVFAIAYVCQLLSLAWLFTLPRHSAEAHDWMIKSTNSPRTGAALIVVLVLALVWSIAVHVLSVIDSTSCLGIAGGKGC